MRTSNQPLRALTRHREPLIAAGIEAALKQAVGIELAQASDGSSFPETDVVICDYESGIAWAHHQRFRRSDSPHAPGIVVVTWRDSEADVRAAVQAGVGGYLLGNCAASELVEAVRAVGRGSPYLCEVAAARVANSLTRTPLTMRETEILRLIGNGMSNKVIAAELNIALGTVKSHARAILDKLGARSRTHALVIAAERGLLDTRSPLRPAASKPAQAAVVAQSRHVCQHEQTAA